MYPFLEDYETDELYIFILTGQQPREIDTDEFFITEEK